MSGPRSRRERRSGKRRVARARARALHLVDIENLAGTGRVTPRVAAACLDAYRSLGVVGAEDLVVVGCNPGARMSVAMTWRGTRCVARAGEDGADLALLDVLEGERAAERFERFVLASGDHAFAGAAGTLIAAGAAVTIVSRRDALARVLRCQAGLDVLTFPDPSLDLEIAA